MDLQREIFLYVMACIQASGYTHLEIAQRLGIPLSVLQAKLMNHANWKLDDISDLCLAIDCEIDFRLVDRRPHERRD